MKIHCQKCKTYLGEIRDATLRKGIVYLCRKCGKQQTETVPNGKYLFDFLTDVVEGRV
jgi:RNase P subunit RPR2